MPELDTFRDSKIISSHFLISSTFFWDYLLQLIYLGFLLLSVLMNKHSRTKSYISFRNSDPALAEIWEELWTITSVRTRKRCLSAFLFSYSYILQERDGRSDIKDSVWNFKLWQGIALGWQPLFTIFIQFFNCLRFRFKT